MNNNKALHVLGSILVGLLFGYIIWGNGSNSNQAMDMDHTMAGMTSSLTGKMGDEFDKEFLSEMIVHHQGAVEMAQMVLNTSKRPELIKLANDIITAQNGEIRMMQDWQKSWFK